MRSEKFHLIETELLLAVLTLKNALLAIDNTETGEHRLIVGDALGVGAFHDSCNFVGQRHTLFLHNLIVTDDAERHVRSDHGKLVEFGIREEFVGNLDNTLVTHFSTLEIIADHDGGRDVFQMQETHHFKKFVGRYMVDDRAILDGGHHEFLTFHSYGD